MPVRDEECDSRPPVLVSSHGLCSPVARKMRVQQFLPSSDSLLNR